MVCRLTLRGFYQVLCRGNDIKTEMWLTKMNPQPEYRIHIREDDKENLEKAILKAIQGINFDEIGDKQLTPEQEELRESYIRSYDAFKNGEYIGYTIR